MSIVWLGSGGKWGRPSKKYKTLYIFKLYLLVIRMKLPVRAEGG